MRDKLSFLFCYFLSRYRRARRVPAALHYGDMQERATPLEIRQAQPLSIIYFLYGRSRSRARHAHRGNREPRCRRSALSIFHVIYDC